MDLRLINASLPLTDPHQLFEVAVSNGKWGSILPQGQMIDDPEALPLEQLDPRKVRKGISVDLQKRIILPGLADCHMHLDKAFTIQTVGNKTGTLHEAICNYKAAAPGFTKDQIKARMRKTVLHALSFGTTSIRSHLDFNCRAGVETAMRTVYAALELKEEMKDAVELQFFPMCPYDQLSSQALDALEESLKLGLDGLGGAPHLSEDPHADIDLIFKLAMKHDKPIDLHADENDDPAVRTVDYIARQTIRYGFQGRVTVGHLCSLSAMDQHTADVIIRNMADARLMAVTLPGVNMYLQGRGDQGLVRRGVTRVKELIRAGVPLAAASDNIQDPFHPFGRGDLLQIGLLSAYAAHLTSEGEKQHILRMITEIPAAILGMKPYGIQTGNEADFAVFDAVTVNELLSWLPAGRWIFRKGENICAARQIQMWK